MQRGNIYLSIGEEEWLKYLVHYMMNDMGKTEKEAEMEALEEVIRGKRENAFMQAKRGNIALSRQIKMEIGEWGTDDEERFIETQRLEQEAKK